MAYAPPVILAEMREWIALGGGNSGIVGDAYHNYGFHRAANEVSRYDYSRTKDPNGWDGPYVNWSYACAGDFDHKNRTALRYMHRKVLYRLMAGELPMICEFIGKPWSDRPVYYWARWNGIKTLQRYTGDGHDHWSHISWYRSRVGQRAYLWRQATPAPAPAPAPSPTPTTVPAWPGRYLELKSPLMEGADVRTWQSRMKVRGWTLDVDGFYGAQSKAVCIAFQQQKGVAADGIVGPVTWKLAWTSPITSA